MLSFDMLPYQGATPVLFGMPRSRVLEAIGPPIASAPTFDGREQDSWGPTHEIKVGYTVDGLVNHVGFAPGEFELSLQGKPIWTPNSEVDPNPFLLELDPKPLECCGFLLFMKLGIGTTGYHDDSPSDRALSMIPKGGWDEFLDETEKPDLSKYGKPRMPRGQRYRRRPY